MESALAVGRWGMGRRGNWIAAFPRSVQPAEGSTKQAAFAESSSTHQRPGGSSLQTLSPTRDRICPNKRLKILLIGHQFQVPSEGQAKACALSRFEDLDISILCPDRYREAEVRWRYPQYRPETSDATGYRFETTRVRNAWCGPFKWYLHWYPHLRYRLATLQPDIIDLWEEPWSLLSAQIARLCRTMLPRCRFISETEQNIDKRLPLPFEFFRSATLKQADYVVARNEEAISVVRKKGFGGPAKVVGNGVDTEMFRPLEKEVCRVRYGVSGFVVGYAGRLINEKGLTSLVSALRQMNGPRVLLLSGDGPLRDTLAAEGFVKWCGNVPREELSSFYNALDVLVLPSRTTASWKEQFGRVLVEAQACGTPVVGSNSGAIPEVIGAAGLVFPEGNVSSLRNALERLRDDASLWEKLSSAGYTQARKRYSWSAIASQMREIYLDCFL